MFGLKTMKEELSLIDSELKFQGARYWELYHKHRVLLERLGLYEETLPAKTVLRSKGGPEQDDY